MNLLLNPLVERVWTLHIVRLILYIMEHWHLRIIVCEVLVLVEVDVTSTGLKLLSSDALLMRIYSTQSIGIVVLGSIAIAQLSSHLRLYFHQLWFATA